MPATRYLTERGRSVGRRSGGQTFGSVQPSFVAPGGFVDAPPTPPGSPALPATAAPAAGGYGALGPLGALATALGIGLGYWATHDLKKPPVPIPYRKRSANPSAWHWSDTSSSVYGGGSPSGNPITRGQYWLHAGCGDAVKWGPSPPAPTFGVPGTADPYGGGFSCGALIPAINGLIYDSPLAAFNADLSAIALSGRTLDNHLVEEWAVNTARPSNTAEKQHDLETIGVGTALYVPEIHFPNEFPDLAPMLWPANPFPQSYPDATPDTRVQPYPVSPDFKPTEDPLIEVPPVPVIIVPGTLPDTTPGPTPAPAPAPEPVPAPGGDYPQPFIPGRWPDQVIEASPSGDTRGRFVPPPPSPADAPPAPGEKQRKINVQSAIPRTWLFLNALTELDEFIDDVWRALPRSMRSKRYVNGKRRKTRTDEKLKDLYRHWQEADVPSIIENVFNDQLGDMFYAAPGRAAKAARRAMWNSTGVDPLIGLGSRRMTEGLSPPTPGSHNRKNALKRGARRITFRSLYNGAGTFFGSGLSG